MTKNRTCDSLSPTAPIKAMTGANEAASPRLMNASSCLLSRRALLAAGALGAISPWSESVLAAGYPDRTVAVISPYSAGGTNDFLARLMALKLGETLRGSFVVDNRTGANGNVGATYVAKSAMDGYTLLMGNSATHGTNPTLYPNQPYDALKDFSPVGKVGSVPVVLVVNAALPIHSIADLIAYGKANPGKLGFGSSGIGGTGHLCGEALKVAAGIDMVHVPYKGDAPAVADAMGGQVHTAFVGIASATGPVATGKVRIIAVATSQRVASLPKVPTIAEFGYEGVEFAQWYALYARAGTPQATLDKLNGALKTILARDDVQKSMATQGADPAYTTPAGLATFSKSEITRFREIIQRLNIKVL